MRIFRAASMSGIALVLTFFAIVFASESSSVEFSLDLVTGIATTIPFLWAMGAGFAALLLVPFVPLHDHTSPAFSFAIFVITGFVIPAYLSYRELLLGVHGNPPPIDTKPASGLLMQIVTGGSLGAVSAVAAWLSVRRSRVSNAT
ncbi:MAG: hypothetical protein AB8B57_01835 [Congregibacter sp.]